MGKEFKIDPIPEDFDPEKRKEWKILALVEGKMIEANFVQVDCPYFNLAIGVRPEGFIGLGISEKTSVTVTLISVIEGRIVIGLVYKNRKNLNMEEKEPCLMGGLVKEGETCCDTLKRNVCDLATKKVKPIATDETYTWCRLYQVLSEDREGVRFLKMNIPSEWLEEGEKTEKGIKNFRVKQGYGIGPDTESVRFFFLSDIGDGKVTKDVLVIAAAGLLVIRMIKEGEEIKI
ncbi:MAG: hypothetical protein PHI66_02110 [Candidatus Pacebacteria bacterium]|nr:hypothetical protein [Candidatus Paceibacterota bacterium]